MGRSLAILALLVTIGAAAALGIPLWHIVIFAIIIVVLAKRTNFFDLLLRELRGKDVSKTKLRVIKGGRR